MRIETLFRWMALSCLLLSACSCASVGTKFTPPSPDKLELGKLQQTNAFGLFGKPNHSDSETTTNGTFQIYKYEYAEADLAAVSSRVLLLEFKEGRLNGYFYWSSFEKDKSHFDSNSVDKLKAGLGKLTKDDVLALMGKPEGKAFCPSIISDFKDKCEKNTEAWGWYMSDNINLWVRRDVKSAELIVSFDSSGKVSGVEMEDNTNPP